MPNETFKRLSLELFKNYAEYNLLVKKGEGVSVKCPHTEKLRKQLDFISQSPGVYLFLNAAGQILYVGKARHLKKRIGSYFRAQQNRRIACLMRQVVAIETTSTETENQALLLESNLIKQLKPRYNILLRDDKSYPYIILSKHQRYPRLAFYRGSRCKEYRYFGPFPSIAAVRETLNLLQKLFRLRSCQDSFFRNRTRPCLQYQIKRCSAPCVSLITPEHYQRDVKNARLFLQGKNQTIIDDLAQQMECAAHAFDYETAARLRDQISALREIQQKQVIMTGQGDIDIIGLAQQNAVYGLYVMNVRHGRLLGGKAYFPEVPFKQAAAEVLSAFISQFYLQSEVSHFIPPQIILALKIAENDWVNAALSERSGYKVRLFSKPTGEKKQWQTLANKNAQQALVRHLSNKLAFYKQLEYLQTALQLDNLPQRLECFDVSHTQGEATVASCVVFDQEGPRKMDYRRFNIENITPGDDYAALRQALMRRYKRLKNDEEKLPDLLLIDGGKGQLKQAEQVLEELQINGILVIGVAKGPGRRSGLERLYLSDHRHIHLPADSFALRALLALRDEAHRFAIIGHRGLRSKKQRSSILEDIPGIGAKRRRELLRQFGGLHALKNASAADLAKVPGISKRLAEQIYFALKA